jgi:hypothetical protein
MQDEIALCSLGSRTRFTFSSYEGGNFIMCLLEEAVDQCTNFKDTEPKVHCIIFEDNAEALQAAKVPKIKQRTLNISIKCFFPKKEQLPPIIQEQRMRGLIIYQSIEGEVH